MRLFTPEEANETLPVLRPLVERLVDERRALLELREELAAVESLVAGNGGSLDPAKAGELREAISAAAASVATAIEEVHRLGVQVKDLDRGLVDFPAAHPVTGDEVLLCWELPEPAVAHWHGLAEGFAGRKPLPF